MSDKEMHIVQTEEGQLLTAEYKDGQLQIVEVAPFDKSDESHILSEGTSGEDTRYLQVLDSSKGLVQLDLLNFTLVKCGEGDSDSYQVVGTASTDDGDTTLTCVLADGHTEDNDNQDTYMMMKTEEDGNDPLVLLQSSMNQLNSQRGRQKIDTKLLTPEEILEKAKALQKAKAMLVREHATVSKSRGRKRKSALPPPIEMLSSPNFKLYLYSCKICSFKCNAVKDMSKHKASEHGAAAARGGAGRSAAASLQCARCPFRATMHSNLIKHVQSVHFAEKEDEDNNVLRLDSDDVSDADVLVCGACGFESSERDEFRQHIERAHGINVMLKASML